MSVLEIVGAVTVIVVGLFAVLWAAGVIKVDVDMDKKP